jgi:hypothetical protein
VLNLMIFNTEDSNLRKKNNFLNYKTKTKYRYKFEKLIAKSKSIHTSKTIANPNFSSSKRLLNLFHYYYYYYYYY